MSDESAVWEAVLDALREQNCITTGQVDVEGVDPKTVRRVLYEMAETSWVRRFESRDEWGRGTHYGEITPECWGAYRHGWARRDEGDEHRQDHEYVAAGDQYATAARAFLGDDPPAAMTGTGRAVEMLLRAAICYRLGDARQRGDRRCREGTYIVEDVLEAARREYNPETRSRAPWFGAWYEYLGDLRLHGNVGDPADAYDRARDIYERSEPTAMLYVEAENGFAVTHFNSLVSAVDDDAERWDDHSGQPFTTWLAYKREHLPQLLDAIYERGEWT